MDVYFPSHWIFLFQRKNQKRYLSEVTLTVEKWQDVRCETTRHPQKRDKHNSYRPSREFVFAVPAGRWLSATRSSSRLWPRQPPWIKDGRRHCGNCGPRNRPARPFRWPAMNDSDIWFSPHFWGVIGCWSAEPERVKPPNGLNLINQYNLAPGGNLQSSRWSKTFNS